VSQDVIVREEDCETEKGINVKAFMDGNEVIEELYDRIVGRYSLDTLKNPETGKIIVKKQEFINDDRAKEIIDADIKTLNVRSALTCEAKHGVCSKCYGKNLATGGKVDVGEAVGIIAAQSIGEPGTQLTMRTFHTGGVAGGDITQGLPRVEELFEARKPKGLAIISEIAGKVSINETRKKKEVIVTSEDKESKSYTIPYGSRIKVRQDEEIEPGDEITEGSVNPHDILSIKGLIGVQNYIVKEVQRVYKMQGVDINDKHVEVIVRQMLNRVKIEDSGDTDLLPGSLVNIFEFQKENDKIEEDGGEAAVGKRVLLGITKASLATDSFLSAASFQETTRVLTEAAIKGKEDHLLGLKENVIIGKLIPAGTGMRKYKSIAVNRIGEEEKDDTKETEEVEIVEADNDKKIIKEDLKI
ncbi:MAG: DNA-directed RNA polymerase subunit beta', partial [Senegalia sp. (in: firmicutes)]